MNKSTKRNAIQQFNVENNYLTIIQFKWPFRGEDTKVKLGDWACRVLKLIGSIQLKCMSNYQNVNRPLSGIISSYIKFTQHG